MTASQPTSSDLPAATVIGGGLAGMSAAWHLAATGRAVTILERSHRLGGKAGSEDVFGDDGKLEYRSDHGYHLFPAWYDNVKDLMGAAGISYERITVPGERFISSFGTTTDVTRREEEPAESDLGGGALWLAFLASVLELICADDAELKNTSVAAFIQQRHDRRFAAAAAVRHESLLLKALANRADRMSALSVARMYRRWVSPMTNVIKPSWTALRGPLQTYFIDPLERGLRDMGCVIRAEAAVTDVDVTAGRITSVGFDSGNDHHRLDTPGPVVLAVPPNAIPEILGEDPPAELQDLLTVARLRMATMSAVDVHYADLVETPADHFSFINSTQSLTAYDITRNWDDAALPTHVRSSGKVDRTILQVIATDPEGLEEMADPDIELKERVLAELRQYMPDHEIDGDSSVIHVNQDAQLFMNDVGVEDDRPPVNHPGVTNLFLAGDYCRSSIDVASMEAAVATGRQAAEAAITGTSSDPAPNVPVAIRAAAGLAQIIPRTWPLIARLSAMRRKPTPQ